MRSFRSALYSSLAVVSTVLAAPASSHAQSCEAPNVMILFDVSGSMKVNNKYTTAINGIDSALSSLESRANFGLGLFPAPSQGYCFLQTDTNGSMIPDVPMALNNRWAIHDVLFPDGSNYCGGPQSTFDTAIFQALESGGAIPGLNTAQRAGYLILVTDGVQDCHNYGDYDNEDDRGAAEIAENRDDIELIARNLALNGIQTFAVGFGANADPQTLARVAIAAGTAKQGCNPSNPTSCFYLASDSNGLSTALSQIVQQISSEVCDGLDNDCDGWVDNVQNTSTRLTKSCSSSCGNGSQYCDSDVGSGVESWSACSARQPSTEICDGIDNDCDGTNNENLVRSCNDICGNSQTCTPGGTWTTCPSCSCSPPGSTRSCGPTGVNLGANSRCKSGAQTCGGNNQWGGCQGAVFPGVEICNGIDDDCDGEVDESDAGGSLTQGCEHECGTGTQACTNGGWGTCVPPEVTCMSACGPGRQCIGGKLQPECVPDAPPSQICNGVYNQCNIKPTTNCDCDHGEERPCGAANGECAEGVQKCVYGQWSICIGGYSGRPEQCNNIDDNCNGLIDDGEDICEPGNACVCGTCQPTCDDQGRCPDGGACVNGACAVDYCPQGQKCENSRCVAGEPDLPNVTPQITPKVKEAEPTLPTKYGAIKGGCDCHATQNDWSSELVAFAAFLVLRLRRRLSA